MSPSRNLTALPRKLFGTDGIRGRANQNPMTSELALELGRSLVVLLREKTGVLKPRIIVGKDTRLSGYMLETALTSGIVSMGGYALLLGPLPTPAVAFMIRTMRAQGGVMISASHNPYQDNGLKVFGADGFKLSDEQESRMEKWILDPASRGDLAVSEELGRARRIDDASGRYLSSLKAMFGNDFDLQGLRIVFDGANGAAYDCGVKLFEELGAEVMPMACEPNGKNINARCAQADPQLLSEKVLETKADLGIAVDGDADRVMLVDETGVVLSGEHLMYSLATFLKASGRLAQNRVVTTAMANQALETELHRAGIEMTRTQVGDRYVTEELLRQKAVFGGETSGHFLFLDQNTSADGLFSGLEILALLRQQNIKASELRSGFRLLPQRLVSVRVREKIPLEQIPELKEAEETLKARYQTAGRVNVRYSGTEPVLRIMIEGPDEESINHDLAKFSELVKEKLS